MKFFLFFLLINLTYNGSLNAQQTVVFNPAQQSQAKATNDTESPVKWYSFQEALDLQKKSGKTMFVDVFTYWCGPCRMLDAQTFNHPVISKYLNENFIAVKFNAESNEPINFHERTFVNPSPNADPTARTRKSTHLFTSYIADNNGRIAYPTMVFVDGGTAIYEPLVGFLRPEQLEPILKYMSDSKLQQMNYNEFLEGFKSEIQ